MSDRLDELRRQRDLLRQHLAWIESEIASQAESGPADPARAPPPVLPISAPDDRDAEAILQEFRQPAASIAKRTRLGCLLYFAAAVALMAFAIAVLYLRARAARGH